MGVDAEMFVRIKGRENWLTETQVRKASVDMSTTIGAENFMIWRPECASRGLESHHALSIVGPFVNEFGEAPSLSGKVVWLQDGPAIVADDDEQLIRVHMHHRYYGPGYERGPWPEIRATAEWLEMRFAGHEVWYGGDSGGIVMSPFSAAARQEINLHYLSRYMRDDDYFAPKNRRMFDSVFGESLRCQCSFCDIDMLDCGGGGGLRVPGSYTFFNCSGCGVRVVKTFEGQCFKAESGNRWTKGPGVQGLERFEP
jgi:hypothetical protein